MTYNEFIEAWSKGIRKFEVIQGTCCHRREMGYILPLTKFYPEDRCFCNETRIKDDNGWGYYYADIDIVREDNMMQKEFTKSDLETGMVVEHRDGKLALVIFSKFNIVRDNPQGLALCSESHYVLGGSINDDLTITFLSAYDIVKIYKITCAQTLTSWLNRDNLIPIWERKKIKKYTIEIEATSEEEARQKLCYTDVGAFIKEVK